MEDDWVTLRWDKLNYLQSAIGVTPWYSTSSAAIESYDYDDAPGVPSGPASRMQAAVLGI